MADALSFIDNFPVKFNLVDDSCLSYDGRSFCQLAQFGDTVAFAFKPKTTAVTLTNPNFTGSLTGWNPDVDWSYDSNTAKLTGANPLNILYQGSIAGIASNIYYKVAFTLSNVSGTDTFNVSIGNGTAFGIVNPLAGRYTVYIKTGTVTIGVNDNLSFFATAGTINLNLDTIVLEQVSQDYAVAAYDTVSTTFKTPLTGGVFYNQYGEFTKLWSQLTGSVAGCYKIALIDTSNVSGTIVTNGTFTGSAAGWTIVNGGGAGWAYGSNKVTHTGSDVDNITQNLTTVVGASYIVRFTISNATIGAAQTVSAGATTFTYSSAGTYVFAFTATSTSTALTFQGSGAAVMDLDNVYVSPVSGLSYTLSECYNLRTTQPCTKKLSWTNSVDGFGIPYSNISMTFYMRLECDIRNSKYPGEKNRFIDSGGNNKLYYSNVRKNKDLIISEIPEYMHDALAVGLAHPNFYIDSVQYVSLDDDYQPEWDLKTALKYAKAQVLIEKYTQDEKSID